ncbi:MAG: flagellar biosynthesis protein FliQ [Alphaproteobacteria bacterium]|nr:flagellar biosynthesis protein FliQ [Alphaproteobacteria bacterium]
MTPAEALDIMRDALLVTLMVAGPLMAVALVIGLSVSLLQALTQIQEATLAFVPKIVVMFLASLLFLPFMLATMTGFMERISARIIGFG